MSLSSSKGSLSPSRSSQAATVSSLLASSQKGLVGGKSLTPITPQDIQASNVMTVMVDTLKIKSSLVKLDSELYIKMCLGKDSRTLNQKGHTVKDGYSFYSVDEQALFIPGKNKVVSLEVEAFTSSGDSVAKGALIIDTHAYLKFQQGKWDAVSMKSKVETGNKNVRLMQTTGEIKMNVTVKPEAYWSDSESDSSTATNSVTTTPGSVLSASSVNKMVQYLSGNKKTPLGSANKVAFTSPVSVTQDKENLSHAANIKKETSDKIPQISKSPAAQQTVASAGKLKSALKVSSNSSTFTYSSNTASAQISGTKEKKEVTVNAKSPTKGVKTAHSGTVFDFNKLLMATIAALAFVASLWLSSFLPVRGGGHLSVPAPVRTISGNAVVLYNPAKKIRLVDEDTGSCMSWKWGLMGGKARFSRQGCRSFWNLRRAAVGDYLQLEHSNGKCLCPRQEFAAQSSLKLSACSSCTSGWSLDKSGALRGGHSSSRISTKQGILGKSEAVLDSVNSVRLAAYNPIGPDSNGPLKKYVTF
jgi:hypothetical protein